MTRLLSRSGATLLVATAVGFTMVLSGQGLAAAPASGVTASGVGAPTLTAPVNDPSDSIPLKDVVLQWQPVDGATGYQVEISPDNKFTNNQVTLPDGGMTVNTSYDVPLSLPHAAYFWRVRAAEGSSYGDWSQQWEFLREWDASTNPSGAFSMVSDPGTAAAGSVAATNPMFSWTPVPDASFYSVRISTDAGFASTNTFDCVTDATSLYPYTVKSATEATAGSCFDQTSLTNGTRYYWEVRPYDDSTAADISADTGNDPNYECSAAQPECDAVTHTGFDDTQSGTFTFQAPATTGQTPAGQVTGLETSWRNSSGSHDCTTGSGTGNCATTPTFSWNPVPNANDYQVHVYLDPDDTNTFRVYDTPYTELTPRDLVFDNQTHGAYYWTVTAGTCATEADNPTCAQAKAGSTQTCPQGDKTSTPVVNDVSATPTGDEGAGSVPGGTTVSVTLTGTGFTPDAVCVTPSAGKVKSIDAASDTSIRFTYYTPYGDASSQVTFIVTNDDGAQSASSSPLTVDALPSEVFYPATTSAVSAFRVDTGNVDLSAPADNAAVSGHNLTYAWSDYLQTGGQGAAEAENYELQVATDRHFDNVVFDDPHIDMTQFIDPKASLSDGEYFWRVGVLDESGNLLGWSPSRALTVDDTDPSVSVPAGVIKVTSPVDITTSEALHGVVTGKDSPSFRLVPTVSGPVVTGTVSGSGRHFVFRPSGQLVTGATYALELGSGLTDAAGNPATLGSHRVVTVSAVADNRSHAWHRSIGWKNHHSSTARGRTYAEGASGSSAAVQLTGRTITLYGCKSPTMGQDVLSVNGKRVATVSLHKNFTECGVVLWSGKLPAGVVKFRVRATDGSGDYDAVVVKR